MNNGMQQAAVHHGWYLLALRGEITQQVTPFMIGPKPLIAICDGGPVRVFDGTCPHRGASLGHGGELIGGRTVRCPFHGRRIALGEPSRRWSVCEHRVVDAGGAIFARMSGSPDDDRGFEQALKSIMATRRVVEAFALAVPAPAEYVTENAFDVDHFPAVHRVPRLVGQEFGVSEDGDLAITTEFVTLAPPWDPAAAGEYRSRFHARAFSPNLVMTEFGPPESAHVVFTGAVPVTARTCDVRVAFAVNPALPRTAMDALIAGARQAIDQDVRVWSHLDLDAAASFTGRDAAVLAFRQFCLGFGPQAR